MIDTFFFEDFAYDEDGRKHLESPESRSYLAALAGRLDDLSDFTHDAIERVVRVFAEKFGLKVSAIVHPARVAVSGKTKGAGLFEMMEVLGRERTVARLRRAADA
jgi:glutamyl-tRNA synthetase